MNPVLELKNIYKKFPGGVVANNHISFDLFSGEIHALLGENGAGKTTLMNILYGLVKPDSGEIYIKGELTEIHSPKDAITLGIGMVHQHFMLVPTMTATQNIVLGQEKAKGLFFSQKEAERAVVEISSKYGLEVDFKRKIWELSVGEKQRVEILKSLYRGAEILVLDEPTTVLTPKETDLFFEILRSMVSKGISIIFITHKLEEVMKTSDRISVLRRGILIGTSNKKQISEIDLARMMVGRDVSLDKIHINLKEEPEEKPILSFQNVSVIGNYGQIAVKNLNLDLFRGEILGIAGVDGNGQTELAESVAGLRKLEGGKIIFNDDVLPESNPMVCISRGIAYIPVERNETGSVETLPLTDNMILKNHRFLPFSKKGILNHKEIEKFTKQQVEIFDVRCGNIGELAKTLSGGNLQKLIFSREIALNPKLIIAEQPTRGLDISAIEFVRNVLIEQRANNVAILLISADLDEIFALSDRIAVLSDGEINYICKRAKLDLDKISLAMAAEKFLCEG